MSEFWTVDLFYFYLFIDSIFFKLDVKRRLWYNIIYNGHIYQRTWQKHNTCYDYNIIYNGHIYQRTWQKHNTCYDYNIIWLL